MNELNIRLFSFCLVKKFLSVIYFKMLSYLKIEIFAYELFQSVWLKGGLISRKYDATQIYKDECLTDNDYKDACDKLFYDAVLCRRILFQRIYTKEIIKGKDIYFDSVSDFYKYIHSTCNHCIYFDCLSVFERMFATCAFVLNLCFYNRENENVDIITFGHICWATYFDAFTEEFYEQGGWSQLKNVANSYTLPLKFLQMCLKEPENAVTEVTEAIENYKNLKQTSIIHEFETVSMLWVKSNINNLHSTYNNPVEFADKENNLHTEYILDELKRLCNPCASEVLQYDEECSERSVFDSDSFYIPLTPTSQESKSQTNSFSFSFCEIGEDALSASSLVEIFSECETDDSDFTHQSCLNDPEDITSSNYCDATANGNLEVFEQPIEFESICVISYWEQDRYISRSMIKMHLNHDTLEIEEKKISESYEKNISSNTSDVYSVEDQILNTTDKILVPQKMMNNKCQMLENSLDVVELDSNDTPVKVFSVIENKQSHNKCFKKGEFAYETNFPNIVLSHENHISISDWDEKYLENNASTPNKIKTILKKELVKQT